MQDKKRSVRIPLAQAMQTKPVFVRDLPISPIQYRSGPQPLVRGLVPVRGPFGIGLRGWRASVQGFICACTGLGCVCETIPSLSTTKAAGPWNQKSWGPLEYGASPDEMTVLISRIHQIAVSQVNALDLV